MGVRVAASNKCRPWRDYTSKFKQVMIDQVSVAPSTTAPFICSWLVMCCHLIVIKLILPDLSSYIFTNLSS